MAETITREAWLRLELEAAETYLARFGDSADPVDQAQVTRRRSEAAAFREELAQLGGRSSVRFRLAGHGIEGNNAPVDLVKEIVHRYGQIADEHGAGVLVAPASSGSHVIEFVAPAQTPLPTFDTFAEAADAVIGFSPDTLASGESLEQHALIHAADLTTATLLAVSRLVAALAKHRVDAVVDLESPARKAQVTFRRQAANDLDRILRDLHQVTVELEVRGLLRGFTALGGQFEIEADRAYRGRVPKALRAAASGIPLGSEVRALIEQITTTLQSGDHRVRFRLKSIESGDS
jgi:hypothetical protein